MRLEAEYDYSDGRRFHVRPKVRNGSNADIDAPSRLADPKSVAPHSILKTWWSETGAEITTRETPEAEIVALENRYGGSLPDEFRGYLKLSAPVEENWDVEDGNWWPVERIKNIPEEYDTSVSDVIGRNASKHLIFLDYLTWSWAWAISCADDETRGRVALIGGAPDGYVAESFAEFVERYTADWDSISRVHAHRKPSRRFRRWFGRG